MFNVDDILVSKSGYNCTLVNFYKVKRVSRCNVWLQEMEQMITSHDGYCQAGYVVPTSVEKPSKPFRRKIQTSDYCNECYVKINDYEHAYEWNGKEVAFDSYD